MNEVIGWLTSRQPWTCRWCRYRGEMMREGEKPNPWKKKCIGEWRDYKVTDPVWAYCEETRTTFDDTHRDYKNMNWCTSFRKKAEELRRNFIELSHKFTGLWVRSLELLGQPLRPLLGTFFCALWTMLFFLCALFLSHHFSNSCKCYYKYQISTSLILLRRRLCWIRDLRSQP